MLGIVLIVRVYSVFGHLDQRVFLRSQPADSARRQWQKGGGFY